MCCGLELTDEVVANITDYNFTCSLCLSAAAAPKKSGRVRTPKKREEAPQTLAAAGDALAPKGKAASGGGGSGGKSGSNKKKAAPQNEAANSGGGGKKAKVGAGKNATGAAASPTPYSSSSSTALSSTRDGRGTSSQQVSVFADEAAIIAALRPDRSASALGEGEYVEESIMVVEKFLGRKNAAPPDPEAAEDEVGIDASNSTTPAATATAGITGGGVGAAAAAAAAPPVEWYLVKWRGLSYLHLSWEVAADIEAVDLAGRAKLRRWLATNPPLFDETTPEGTAELAAMEFFEPEAIECQVVLACDHDDPLHARSLGRPKYYRAVTSSSSKGGKSGRGSKGRSGAAAAAASTMATSSSSSSGGSGVAGDENPDAWWDENDAEDEVKYLVKWRGLPFEAATWEDWGLIKPDAHAQVKRFWAKERRPPNRELERRPMPPEIKLYKRLHESPLFGLMFGEESSATSQKKPSSSSSPPPSEAASDAIVTAAAAGVATASEVGTTDGTNAVDSSAVGTADGLAAAPTTTTTPPSDERALVEVAAAPSTAAADVTGAAECFEPTVMEVEGALAADAKNNNNGAAASAASGATAPGGCEGEAMQEDLSGATTTVVAAEEKAPVDDDTAAAGLRLREYQLEGVNWLVWNWYNSRPSILADEM